MAVSKLKGRLALISGAGRGIGRAVHLFCIPESDYISGPIVLVDGGC